MASSSNTSPTSETDNDDDNPTGAASTVTGQTSATSTTTNSRNSVSAGPNIAVAGATATPSSSMSSVQLAYQHQLLLQMQQQSQSMLPLEAQAAELQATQPTIVGGGNRPKIITGDELRPYDCLLGRGTGPNENYGNRYYRDLVSQMKDEYNSASSRHEKDACAIKVLDTILKEKGGKFYRKIQKRKRVTVNSGSNGNIVGGGKSNNNKSGNDDLYEEIDDMESIMEKTRQTFLYICRRKPNNANVSESASTTAPAGKTAIDPTDGDRKQASKRSYSNETSKKTTSDITSPTPSSSSTSRSAQQTSLNTPTRVTAVAAPAPTASLPQNVMGDNIQRYILDAMRVVNNDDVDAYLQQLLLSQRGGLLSSTLSSLGGNDHEEVLTALLSTATTENVLAILAEACRHSLLNVDQAAAILLRLLDE